MTVNRPPRIVRVVLWFSPVALIVVAFFSALPWLRAQSDALVLAVGATAAISVMGYAVFIAIRSQRGMDEVERAGARFAAQTGALAGSIAIVLLMIAPPFQNLILHWAGVLGTGSPESFDRESVLLAFDFGFSALVLAQTLGALVAYVGWNWRMARQ